MGIYSNKGTESYCGEWKDGAFHGWGICCQNDEKYIGQFKNDKREGQGFIN
jgi:hypothetical protein